MTAELAFEYRIRPAAILDVGGPDRAAFLQGQVTQDVRLALPGVTVPVAGLTPKGKILYSGRLAGLGDALRLVLPRSLAASVLAHLTKYAVFQKVSLTDRSNELVRIGIAGDSGGTVPAEGLALGAEGEFSEDWLVPAGGVDAFRADLAARGGREMEPARANVLRVEAGRPEFGIDFDETHLPGEVGISDAVSATKGCYVGQEIVARLKTYGRVHRRLVGFRFPDGPVSPGQTLSRPDAPAASRVEPGRVTSAAISPRFGAIGLGWISREVETGDELAVTGGPESGRRAVPTALPFG